MKKITLGCLFGIFFALLTVTAVHAGDPVYATTTRAYIDGECLPCYVYQGYPYIVAEDLGGYGFDVKWDAHTDILDIQYNPEKKFYPYHWQNVSGGYTRRKVAEVVPSGTKVRLGEDFITAYSLDGRMLICLDDLYRYGHVNYYSDSDSISFTSRKFMKKNPDWEILIPAQEMLFNLHAAQIAALFAAYTPAGNFYGNYSIATTEPKEVAGVVNYLEQRLQLIEQNQTFYYKGKFYHYTYTLLTNAKLRLNQAKAFNGRTLDWITRNRQIYTKGFDGTDYIKFDELFDLIIPYLNLNCEKSFYRPLGVS